MKLGLNACSLIVFMLIMGLVAAASTNSAVATSCYWDATANKNVCVSDLSQLSQPTASQPTASQPTANGQSTTYYNGCHWDSTTNKNVCGGVIPTASTATPYTYGYNSYNSYPYNSYNSYPYNSYNSYAYSYYDPYYSYYYSSYSYNPYYSYYGSSGYHYYSSIYTSLCGWQYNVYVNFDNNCANDYPA